MPNFSPSYQALATYLQALAEREGFEPSVRLTRTTV